MSKPSLGTSRTARRSMMRIKGRHIALALLALISIGLIFSAIQQSDPYVTVTEVVRHSDRYVGRQVSILGVIADAPESDDNLKLNFHLTDSQDSINVVYSGTLPQNFAIGSQAVIVGTLLSGNTIEASNILLKCPSKYGDTSQTGTAFDCSFFATVAIAAIVGTMLLVFAVKSSHRRHA
jgi:cytochrome c-type biogenesis protein CcmE